MFLYLFKKEYDMRLLNASLPKPGYIKSASILNLRLVKTHTVFS